MGAETYEVEVHATTPDEVRAKFAACVEECLYDYGHAGYTGTFAEKSEVKILPRPTATVEGKCQVCGSEEILCQYWTRDAIREHPDGDDKWGPAIAGEIAKDTWLLFGWCSS